LGALGSIRLHDAVPWVPGATLASDRHIDAAIALDDLEFLEPQSSIAHIDAVAEMKFVTVPGTHDVHIALIVTLAEKAAIGIKAIDHLGHPDAFAGRPTLMRTIIVVGEIFAAVPDDGDFQIADPNDPHGSVGELVVLANLDFRHPQPLRPVCDDHVNAGMAAREIMVAMRIDQRVGGRA
jgi:hypothetical protein